MLPKARKNQLCKGNYAAQNEIKWRCTVPCSRQAEPKWSLAIVQNLYPSENVLILVLITVIELKSPYRHVYRASSGLKQIQENEKKPFQLQIFFTWPKIKLDGFVNNDSLVIVNELRISYKVK